VSGALLPEFQLCAKVDSGREGRLDSPAGFRVERLYEWRDSSKHNRPLLAASCRSLLSHLSFWRIGVQKSTWQKNRLSAVLGENWWANTLI